MQKLWIIGLIAWGATRGVGSQPEKKILEQEKSRFGLVSVHESAGKRYISIGAQEQSGVNLANKREWVYTYMYLLSVGILAAEPGLAEKPANVLIIRLGGGSFADYLAEV